MKHLQAEADLKAHGWEKRQDWHMHHCEVEVSFWSRGYEAMIVTYDGDLTGWQYDCWKLKPSNTEMGFHQQIA